MKRFLFYAIFIWLFYFVNITAIQKELQKSNEQVSKTYPCYFLMKELYSFFMTSNFQANQKKMQRISIYCCKDHHKIDTQLLWLLLIYMFDETSLNDLKYHIENDSIEKLTLFTLEKYQKLSIPCDMCKKYNDYYILEQSSLPLN